MIRKVTPLEDRFWKKVEKTDTCWLWTGAKLNRGYGVTYEGRRSNRKTLLAHRVSYIWSYGHIPDGLQVLHMCDTPSCVNPAHLFVGTQQENVDDMIRKGRQKGRYKLTQIEVDAIRTQYEIIKSTRQVASIFGISPSQVHRIVARINWK